MKQDDNVSVDTARSTAASPYWRPDMVYGADQHHATGFSPFVAFCFTINYILGTGFLTLPWAFVRGGLLLSAVTLMSMGVVSDVAKDYLLDTMARAEAMLDTGLHWRTPTQLAVSNSPYLTAIANRAQAKQQQQQGPSSKMHRPDPEQDAFDEESTPLMVVPASINYTNNNNASSSSSFHKSPSAISLPTPMSSAPGTPNGSQHGPPRQPNKILAVKPGATSSAGYMVRERKFEVNALCRVFLGKPALAVYSGFICLYIYCSLWAYAAVFCSAMSQAFPLLHNNNDVVVEEEEEEYLAMMNYVLYAVVFAAMVIPMSCLELNEQVAVQVGMTICRFVMLFLMWTTCATLAQDIIIMGDANSDASSSLSEVVVVPLVQWEGLPQMLPICVFAHIFHHSIPGLSHPVARKKNLGNIFRATVVFCTLAYSLLAWRVGSVLGSYTQQSANLNWRSYRGGVQDSSLPTPWWAQAIAVYVVCFPALDVLSAFPLNAITLGNNLLGAVYGKDVHKAEVRTRVVVNKCRRRLGGSEECHTFGNNCIHLTRDCTLLLVVVACCCCCCCGGGGGTNTNTQNDRWIRIRFRLLAGLPPIVLAVLVRELGTITDYAGTTGFIIGFSFPALLYLYSRRQAVRRDFHPRTQYSSYGSNPWAAWCVCAFGFAMVLYVVFFLVRG
eukprot:scaffold2551_cov162-Amphora_coffeaeformis.AAC.2